MILGAVETGGTKINCAIGDEKGNILKSIRIATNSPEKCIPEILDFFLTYRVDSIGIGSFGPLELHRDSPTYGSITATPKPGWRNYPIVSVFKKKLGVPVGFDTDVNAALLGELTYGNIRNIENAVYLTIGTGIGGGVISNGKLLHGMLHPEIGHIPVRVHEGDNYSGKCPYHSSCLEGMASGPAIAERWGKPGEQLRDKSEVWDLEAWYIAQACAICMMTLSPQIIILGGGVMENTILFPLIREKTLQFINGYLPCKEIENLEQYIVPASLNGLQGIKGCIKLALDALEEQKEE